MRFLSRLPQSLPRQFRDRVRQACEHAALNDRTVTYQELAEAVIGDADRGSPDRRFIRLVDAALCENMKDDAKARRPFAAVAVRRADTGHPGEHFVMQCIELRRWDERQSIGEFVAAEWAKFREHVQARSVARTNQAVAA